MSKWQTMAGLMLGAAAGLVPAQALASDTASLDYTGSVEFRPDAGALSASWTILIKDPKREEVTFALSSALGDAYIQGPDVRQVQSQLDARFEGAVRLFKVDLAPSVDGKDRLVRFSYGGPLFPEAPFFPINTLDPDKIELTVDSFWFPFDARFDAQLTANLGVRVEGDWSAVGVGTVEAVEGGFRVKQTKPSLDIAFSLLSRSQTVQADNYVIHDARTEPGTKMTELSKALDDCTRYLNDLAGPAGPLPQASIIVTDRAEGGYSRGTLIALTDIEGEGEEYLQQFICHELAHYWSYANAGGPENWINEGVADYLANMAIRDAMGETVFADRMARYAERLEGRDLPPIWTPDATERPPYLIMYRAAPLALQALETRMGREAFAMFMRDVMLKKIRSTPELLTLLEANSDPETRIWFEARLAD